MTRTLIRYALAAIWLVMAAGCTETPEPEGFAGLADSAPESDFHQPSPEDRIELPEDWGPHPEHRIEWWYLTANLETAEGEPMGIQWTQFRQGLEPRPEAEEPPPASRWPLQSAWMAHGAVSFQGNHWFSERFARGNIGQAGARAEPLQVWLDHWQLEAVEPGRWQLTASGESWSYQLELVPDDRIIRHGDQGFSAKADNGQGSMYFSLTDIAISGTVTVDGVGHQVTGTGWLDREWSSQFLRSDQQGWDWFALRLDDGSRLMVFRVGRGEDAFRSGTLVNADGSVHSLTRGQIRLAAESYRETERGDIPVTWRIEVPSRALDLVVNAPQGDYWNAGLYPYWESPVTVTGTANGEGYMELTGYTQ
ncbi:lipocalin-like domain-containing protein [Marinobacter zhanjiangensis]|uniref:Iron ABC transporter permease n=1 Tax=Marinobacter zhanjiangensis TaxID=578215 RepID=A0ABQ3B029_9GAMM|nr:lipocalin-like domain-containing protein [Marinobacter zhanjiangensis]GGY72610.1 iron ABC transporter permease [Marinobacter zhanjiangensis]